MNPKKILIFLTFMSTLVNAQMAPLKLPPQQTPLDKETQKLQKKMRKLELEKRLRELEFEKSISEKRIKLSNIELETALKTKEKEKEDKKILDKIKESELKLKILEQKHKAKTIKMRLKLESLALENKRLAEKFKKDSQTLLEEQLKNKIEKEKLALEQMKYKFKLDELETNLVYREKEKDWDSKTNKNIKYRKQPFENGVLHISDRRIEINGAIVYGSADYITERIYYFNNKSEEYPIFLVIDRSPGGSVMEGYRILKAMEASKAPIHVLVKSYAASMAAIITSLAEHSYAYDSAIILHHQPSGLSYGNLATQEKGIKKLQEWAKRLLLPIAKKMGITLENFYKEMYKKDPNGNWEEFGDKALTLKWVNNIAYKVAEEGIIESPDIKAQKRENNPHKNRAVWDGVFSEKESKAKGTKKLPKLDAFDFYFIYGNKQYEW